LVVRWKNYTARNPHDEQYNTEEYFSLGVRVMPTISIPETTEKLAKGVSNLTPAALEGLQSDYFADKHLPEPPVAAKLADQIREGRLYPEELVDLWHAIFVRDRDIWYNEETDEIHFNENVVQYANRG